MAALGRRHVSAAAGSARRALRYGLRGVIRRALLARAGRLRAGVGAARRRRFRCRCASARCRVAEPAQRPGLEPQLPLADHLGLAADPGPEPAGAAVLRPPAADATTPGRRSRSTATKANRTRACSPTARSKSTSARRPTTSTRASTATSRCRRRPSPTARAAVEGGRPHRPVRMARPPHPLDVAGAAAAGQGQGQAHADLRLARADRRRAPASGDVDGQLSGRRSPRSAPVAAIVIGGAIVVLGLALVLVDAPAPRTAARPSGGASPAAGPPSGSREAW